MNGIKTCFVVIRLDKIVETDDEYTQFVRVCKHKENADAYVEFLKKKYPPQTIMSNKQTKLTVFYVVETPYGDFTGIDPVEEANKKLAEGTQENGQENKA